MTSKITIEADFETGKPYFRVLEDLNSDDMRDKALHGFRSKLKHDSLWCRLDFPSSTDDRNAPFLWTISPIPPDHLGKEANHMLEVAGTMQAVPDNSDGFHAFLDSQAHKWIPAEHSTLIDRNINPFLLGQSFAEYKAAHSKS